MSRTDRGPSHDAAQGTVTPDAESSGPSEHPGTTEANVPGARGAGANEADRSAGSDGRRIPLTQPGSVNPWLARAGLVALAVALFAVPDLLDDPTRVRQWAEYLCYAMIAVGLSIAWGRAGLLALGQGVFFGLGAYAMGMYLSLEQVPSGAMPEFMQLYSNYTELPLLWRPFESFWFAAVAALLVPMSLAGLLGWLVFRNRIRGPYFAILTQATTLVFWLLLVGQLELTAGTNGLTNFRTTFGRNRFDPGTSSYFYTLAAAALVAVVLLGRQLVRSRFGRLLVAIRDNENRVRFLGYDPALAKTGAFVVAAGMAGLAGAFAAPIIGIVAPNQFDAIPSILMIAWVAAGGRGSIYGALVGALLISWTKTTVSESRPEDWLYVQGLLFVVVIAWVPGGLAGLADRARARLANFAGSRRSQPPGDPRPATELEVVT